MAIDLTYKDVNPFYGFNTLPDTVVDEDAINSSLGNILSITPSERWYYPTFGSEIRKYVWQPLDIITANKIFHDVVLAIAHWEPRIQLLPQTAVIANQLFQRFDIDIYYRILENNQNGQFTAYIKVSGLNPVPISVSPSIPVTVSPEVPVVDDRGNLVEDDQGNPYWS